MTFEELNEAFRKLLEETRGLVEQEKLLQKRAQRQQVLSYFLAPTAAAACIFGPDKKENLERGNETNQ